MTDRDQAARALRDLLHGASVDLPRVRAFLDGLDHDARVHAVCSLRGREQGGLWRAAERVYEIPVEHLVPASVAANTPVRHFGRNTMPAFSVFEKRFYRNERGELFGANFQTMSPLTGPGYFRVCPHPDRREIVLDGDRAQLPTSAPPGWPAIVPNERGFSRFVYGFLTDTLRKVSEHVSIGMPARHGKPLGSWFVLCRES